MTEKCKIPHLCLYICQTPLLKATYSAFKLYMLLVCVLSGTIKCRKCQALWDCFETTKTLTLATKYIRSNEVN